VFFVVQLNLCGVLGQFGQSLAVTLGIIAVAWRLVPLRRMAGA